MTDGACDMALTGTARRLCLAVAGLVSLTAAVPGARRGYADRAAADAEPRRHRPLPWEGLPKATREAVAASGPSADDVYRAMNDMNPSLMDVARAQCPSPATTDDAQKVSDAWVAVALQAWAETQLYRQDKIGPASLEDAWRRFTRPSAISSSSTRTSRPTPNAPTSPR